MLDFAGKYVWRAGDSFPGSAIAARAQAFGPPVDDDEDIPGDGQEVG